MPCYRLAGAVFADNGCEPRVLEGGGQQNAANSLLPLIAAAIVHIGEHHGELIAAAYAAHFIAAT